MYLFGWSPLILFFTCSPVPLIILRWLWLEHRYKRHFHVLHFFYFPSQVEVHILRFTFFQLYPVVNQDSKVHNFVSSLFLFLFFLLIFMSSVRLAEIKWSVCMLKSHWSLYVSFSRTAAGLCMYHLFVLSNLKFLHIYQWITLPTQSYLILYTFCGSLLHSLILRLIVSSIAI